MKNLYFKSSNFSLLLLAFCFLLTTGMQCKKTSDTTKEEVLPAETQTGKQTFGCLVNGEVWLPKTGVFLPRISTSIQFNILNFSAVRTDEGIIFGIRNMTKTGIYELVGENKAEYSISGNIYKSFNGFINIKKYDSQLNILSGTFSFIAKNEKGDLIKIEDGRFDVTYTN